MKKVSPLKRIIWATYVDRQSETEWKFSFVTPEQQDELNELYDYAMMHQGDLLFPNFGLYKGTGEPHVIPLAEQIQAQKRKRIEQLEALFVKDSHCLGDHHSNG